MDREAVKKELFQESFQSRETWHWFYSEYKRRFGVGDKEAGRLTHEELIDRVVDDEMRRRDAGRG